MTRVAERIVHFVVPRRIDDPRQASGGDVFDRHVADELSAIGWHVHTSTVGPDAASRADALLSGLPDDALVLVDGLVARRSPAAIEAAAERIRVVLLAHMVSAAFADADPDAVEGERRALRAARAVIATSEWTRSELIARGLASPARVVVATPGSADAPLSSGTPAGGALLCVGVVAPHKGQDVLIEALAALGTRGAWTCTVAGSLDVCPDYARRIAALVTASGLEDRITLTGALAERELQGAYHRSDLMVAPSRVESYGMAISDALRRGIPVVASSVGGIPQAVAARAATLVPPDQPAALGDALRRWMTEPALRERLKADARRGRSSLPRWSDTAARIATALASVP